MAPSPPTDELVFSAMGTTAHVLVAGPTGRLDASWAATRIGELEAMWSRFVPTSDISRLNARNGMPSVVNAETTTLFSRATLAAELTSWRFNPFVGAAVAGLGYDRSFDELGRTRPATTTEAKATPPVTVTVDAATNVISFHAPESATVVRFDPGAIGKGLAADLVVEELMASGAEGALVNLGGDLRVAGRPTAGDSWRITINEPAVPGASGHVVSLSNGAIATSTSAKRRWVAGGRQHHHIVDPATGSNAIADFSLVTAIAGAGWWAEAAATATMVSGLDDPTLPGISALAIDHRGRKHLIGRMGEHCELAAS